MSENAAELAKDFIGQVQPVSCSTGAEKVRFTAVLTITSQGKTLPTQIIFIGLKNVPPGNFPKDTRISVNKCGVMTSDLFIKEYLPKVTIFFYYKFVGGSLKMNYMTLSF